MRLVVTLTDRTETVVTCDAWRADEHGTLIVSERDDLGGNHTILLVAHGQWVHASLDDSVIVFTPVVPSITA